MTVKNNDDKPPHVSLIYYNIYAKPQVIHNELDLFIYLWRQPEVKLGGCMSIGDKQTYKVDLLQLYISKDDYYLDY
jgi:hypothetical protein